MPTWWRWCWHPDWLIDVLPSCVNTTQQRHTTDGPMEISLKAQDFYSFMIIFFVLHLSLQFLSLQLPATDSMNIQLNVVKCEQTCALRASQQESVFVSLPPHIMTVRLLFLLDRKRPHHCFSPRWSDELMNCQTEELQLNGTCAWRRNKSEDAALFPSANLMFSQENDQSGVGQVCHRKKAIRSICFHIFQYGKVQFLLKCTWRGFQRKPLTDYDRKHIRDTKTFKLDS